MKPDFKKTPIAEYPLKYDNFINDNLPFRTQFTAKYINTWEMLLYSYVRENLRGRNNHYFRGQTVEYYLGLHQYSIQELYSFRTIIAGRQSYWNSFSADYSFILIPDKTTLYPEYLPKWVTNNKNWFGQLSAFLKNTPINFVDYNTIFNKRKNSSIYFYDKFYDVAHWNGNALDVAYKEINEKYKHSNYFTQIHSDSAYTIINTTVNPSTNNEEISPFIRIKSDGLKYQLHNYVSTLPYKWAKCDIILNEKIENGTLLFACDSYFKATHQADFLGANGNVFPIAHNVKRFIQVHYAEPFNLMNEIAKNEKPDIVIEAGVERAIFNGFMKNLNMSGENNNHLLIAGERLLKDSLLIIEPATLAQFPPQNCIIDNDKDNVRIIAQTNDPFIKLPSQKTNKDGRFVVMAKIHSESNTIMQLYYAQGDVGFNENNCIRRKLSKGMNYVHIPIYAKPNETIHLRFDPGNSIGTYTIYPMPDNKELFEEDL